MMAPVDIIQKLRDLLPSIFLAVRAQITDAEYKTIYDREELSNDPEEFKGKTVLMDACDNLIIREDVIEVLVKDSPYQMRFGIHKDGLSAFNMLLNECSSLKAVQLFCKDVPHKYLKEMLLKKIECKLQEKFLIPNSLAFAIVKGASLPVVKYLLKIMKKDIDMKKLFLFVCRMNDMVKVDVFKFLLSSIKGEISVEKTIDSPLYLLSSCGADYEKVSIHDDAFGKSYCKVPRSDLLEVLLKDGRFSGKRFIKGFNGDLLDADILASFRALCMQRYVRLDTVCMIGDLLPTYCRWSPSAFTKISNLRYSLIAKCETPVVEYLMKDYPQEARYPNNQFDDLLILACRPDYLSYEIMFGNTFDPPSVSTIRLLTEGIPRDYITRKFIRMKYNYFPQYKEEPYDRDNIGGLDENGVPTIHLPSINILRRHEYASELNSIMELNGTLKYLLEPLDPRNLEDFNGDGDKYKLDELLQKTMVNISIFKIDYGARYYDDDEMDNTMDHIWAIQQKLTYEKNRIAKYGWGSVHSEKGIFGLLLKSGVMSLDLVKYFIDTLSQEELHATEWFHHVSRKTEDESLVKRMDPYQYTVLKHLLSASGAEYLKRNVGFFKFVPSIHNDDFTKCIYLFEEMLGDKFDAEARLSLLQYLRNSTANDVGLAIDMLARGIPKDAHIYKPFETGYLIRSLEAAANIKLIAFYYERVIKTDDNAKHLFMEYKQYLQEYEDRYSQFSESSSLIDATITVHMQKGRIKELSPVVALLCRSHHGRFEGAFDFIFVGILRIAMIELMKRNLACGYWMIEQQRFTTKWLEPEYMETLQWKTTLLDTPIEDIAALNEWIV
eukprot:TRINITY_DN2729_c0_g1_i3.p1 TRINITY_DN2729_c0_g1~~TRINITY_DN2729_c0_g1_i3.p1  ORF type:complete len:835 (-),score=204.28 TRINITY_DN2729_c0_g1_i3:261-2765(-)